MAYPREPYCVGQAKSVLQCNRAYDKTVGVKPNLPGNVIVIHGVNDVGTSYQAVEKGLCQGLDARLLGIVQGKIGVFTPASYRMPGSKSDQDDKETVEADPDAIFFKRQIEKTTHSPMIPFYWGFRETFDRAGVKNGQRIDQFGNRLDKDLSKGGGPFGNATSTLPDMWNRGMFSPKDVGGDPVRPLLSAPGRMYMVLAAKRLAALIAMIRDFDKDEVVSIVAHSQGCLVSLLAQAFLLDAGLQPADTLILTHPPYSLVEDTTNFFGAIESIRNFGGGTDPAMAGHYDAIADRQTFDARLQTLAKIVQGVVGKKHPTPPLAALTDHAKYYGMVGSKWVASADRDNRGKVYLYFCPEDMTVALDNMQGIGWQGVPDFMKGTALSKTKSKVRHSLWGDSPPIWESEKKELKPLSAIGAGFYQRVFTAKKRLDPAKKTLERVLVGSAPHDFALRLKGEDDHAHVAASGRGHRAASPQVDWPPKPEGWTKVFHTEAGKREGIRSITGEPLHVPFCADLRGTGQVDPQDFPKSSTQAKLPKEEQGPSEDVDPIDAAIASTSNDGLIPLPQMTIDDPRPKQGRIPDGGGMFGSGAHHEVQDAFNKDKAPGDQCHKILYVSRASGDGDQLSITRYETPNEARRRWQHEVSPKSFHGAIIGSSENHRNVTAYDVAIGGGQASSDPNFYAYLCAVADWRLQSSKSAQPRPSIMKWGQFVKDFHGYWEAEPKWRKDVVQGSADYYSSGRLPACVPPLHTGLPSTVVCETVAGARTAAVQPAPKSAPAGGAPAPANKGKV
ncbi:T6SS effector phospholipase Tle3 domain-containing protein [Massilia sp. TSP1-1-2]|uniref:T6SS effector phospholipase Tle3 domain-containing protein n=1 Tax=Massilia sp. TSP1-1-2 TaxID=2804649 RepID=UPI003CFA51CF